jgi:hydroxyacylglutathione hydrolase
VKVPESVELVSPGLWRVTNGGYASNAYVREYGAGECYIVDPGLEGATVDHVVEQFDLHPSAVVCTHGHFDHVGSASFFQDKYAIPVYMHHGDSVTARTSNFLLMAFKLPYRVKVPRFDLVDDGFELLFGDQMLRFRLSPGHTRGSCVLTHGSTVFTGDTMYASGVGLSSLPGEDAGLLRESLRSLWEEIPVDATIAPGHGPTATMSWIKHNNAPLRRFLDQTESTGSHR